LAKISVTQVQFTDEQLIEHIAKGDQKSFERLFRKYYASLCRYADGLLHDTDEAEEIVQQVFVGFWEKREDIVITQSLKSYLYRAVHNHCLNRIKHLKIRETHQSYVAHYEADSYEAVAEVVHKNELEVRIYEAIGRLPVQCQRVFKMSRFEELKYQEIADQLGISIKTVENHIGKALKILRVELIEFLPVIIMYYLSLKI
jgi:RNA polymerase sigma-70 factor, ECF subfamily